MRLKCHYEEGLAANVIVIIITVAIIIGVTNKKEVKTIIISM